jgi:hypothetical protein
MERARRPAPQAGRVANRLVHPVLVGMALVVLAFGINSMSGALHFQNVEWGATKLGSVKVAAGFVAPSLYENVLQSAMNITPTNDVLEKLDRLTKVDRTAFPSHDTHAHALTHTHTRTHTHAHTNSLPRPTWGQPVAPTLPPLRCRRNFSKPS